MHRVNYDQIAHLYDEPLRDHPVNPDLLAYLEERPHLSPATMRVLDVGCGTGKQLAAIHGRFPEMQLIGLDRFMGMLRQAQRRGPAVHWAQGDGVTMPFPANSFDFASNQFSYHHVQRTEQFLGELYRVLRPGGRFAMLNIDPWAMPNWNIYQFFPAALERDYQDFMPPDRFASLMAQAGFRDVQVTHRHFPQEENLANFLAGASMRHRTSQFIALSDADYEAGLQRIKARLAEAEGRPVTFHSDFCLVTVVGDK